MRHKDDLEDTADAAHDLGKDVDLKQNRKAKEVGGRPDGLDPTRYGDWEKNGRCIDF